MRNAALAVCLLLTFAAAVAAQTPRELEAEPVVKLQAGETEVAGQCLTEQELDLIARLDALRRPTLGVEGDGEGDDPAPFDPHYFVGRWEVEGVLPDSPLAESSEFVGTETVRHVEGCAYASTIEAATLDGDVTVESILVYDRRMKYLVRLEEDSRGFEPPQGRPRRRRSRRVLLPPLGGGADHASGEPGPARRPHVHAVAVSLRRPHAHVRRRRAVRQLRHVAPAAPGRRAVTPPRRLRE